MKPIFDFLVSPVDGKRYDNVHKSGLILSSSLEDHKFTQRHAELLATPYWYKGEMKAGDTVIVHHNIFRKMYTTRGDEVSSNAMLSEGKFLIGPDQLYMYQKKGSSDWNAVDPFIFISPIKNDSTLFDNSLLKQLYGIVEYSPTDKFKKGSLVSFQPDCEYEFTIDEKTMYRMFTRNITLIES